MADDIWANVVRTHTKQRLVNMDTSCWFSPYFLLGCEQLCFCKKKQSGGGLDYLCDKMKI